LVTRFVFQIKNKETPIITYKVVHTGANTRPGGFHVGFSSAWYHVPGPVLVKKPDVKPTSKGITMAIINLRILFISSIY
jgi:hypothetical protein